MTAPPDELLASWRRAEQRVCALVMGAPELFEHALAAVRRIADSLAEHTTVADLVAAYEHGPARAAELAGDLPVPPATLAGAAWLVRHRELLADEQAAAVRDRLEAARARGQRWTVLSDPPEPEAAVFGGHEHLEVRLADGLGLRALIDLDPDTYAPCYAVEVVALDPATGAPIGPARQRRTFADRAGWETGLAALRAELDTAPDAPGW